MGDSVGGERRGEKKGRLKGSPITSGNRWSRLKKRWKGELREERCEELHGPPQLPAEAPLVGFRSEAHAVRTEEDILENQEEK